jgi:hypothetical protein
MACVAGYSVDLRLLSRVLVRIENRVRGSLGGAVHQTGNRCEPYQHTSDTSACVNIRKDTYVEMSQHASFLSFFQATLFDMDSFVAFASCRKMTFPLSRD